MEPYNGENSFEFVPVTEESKSLSPVNYYYPFRSSFNSEFGKILIPEKASNFHRDPMRIPPEKWIGGESNDRKSISVGGSEDFASRAPISNHFSSHASATWNSGNASRATRFLVDPLAIYSGSFLPEASNSKRVDFRSAGSALSHFGSISGTESTKSSRISGLTGNFPASADGSAVFGSRNSTVSPPAQAGKSSCDSTWEKTGFPSRAHPIVKNSNRTVQKSAVLGQNRPMMCNFCKNNKEVEDIYLHHFLYDPETKKLSCPVLRKHVCEICGGTGDQAHTLQYCPINRQRGFQAKIPVLLKARTITNSTGKIRRN